MTKIFLTVLFSLLLCLFGMGAMADQRQENRQNYTWISVACILAIVIINIW